MKRFWKHWQGIVLLDATILFAVCTMWVRRPGLSPWEGAIFGAIYSTPETLQPFAIFVTQFGSAWVLLALVGLFLVIRKNPALSLEILRAGVLTYVITQLLKALIGRPRPALLLDNVVSFEVATHGDLGFPSGHTALATTIALLLWARLPRMWRPLLALWIIGVGWSRIYLGMHSPLDVIGGFLVGVIIATCLNLVPIVIGARAKSRPH